MRLVNATGSLQYLLCMFANNAHHKITSVFPTKLSQYQMAMQN